MSSLSNLVTVSPEILAGTPVFYGTRVPIEALFDYLEAGDSVERFLEHFPAVAAVQAQELLRYAHTHTLQAVFDESEHNTVL